MTTNSNLPIPQLSGAKQDLLAKRRRGLVSALAADVIPQRPTGLPAPLSFAQQRLWVLHQMDPQSAAYNMPLGMKLRGVLDDAALVKALETVVARHEILRTTFTQTEEGDVQTIAPARPFTLPVTDLRKLEPAARSAEVEAIMERESRRPFDLACGPLFRCLLLRLEDREHLLLILMHHSIFDGWSIAVFCRELEAFYQAASARVEPSLPPLAIQYADYAVWQQRTLCGAALQKQVDFWTERLKDAPSSINLPHEPQDAQPSGRVGVERISIPSGEWGKLTEFAQDRACTPFMVLASSLALVLSKWTGQKDLVLGTVVAGRTRRELESMLGCFMNFLPLRASLGGADTGAAVLGLMKTEVIEAYAHQDCPFEKIVEAVNPVRRSNQNPLYNVALLMQNFPSRAFEAGDLSGELIQWDTDAALLDLRFVAEECPEGLGLTCEFDTGLFRPETIQRVLESCLRAQRMLVESPGAPVAEFTLAEGLEAQEEAPREAAVQQTLAIAASFTAEPVGESIRFWMDTLQLPVEIQFAPFNQVIQQLLDANGLLHANRGGMNVLLVRLEDWTSQGVTPLRDGVAASLEHGITELIEAARQSVPTSRVPWLLVICPHSRAALADPGLTGALERAEQRLASELASVPGLHLLLPAEIFRIYPEIDYDDPAANRIGNIPYTPGFFTALGTLVTRRFHAVKRAPKKVIALDCDNTLWTGVCGEDGPRGIRLDLSRIALQQFMRAQQEAGMLLCLCSKNSEADVAEVFRERTDMPLRLEHIVARRVNWRPKSENLRALARELNLGLDSFVLVDDNPVECAEVESACPEVQTIQLPADAAEVPGFLRHLWVFDHLKITAEDRRRAELYQQNSQRRQFQTQTRSMADFVAGLNIEIRIEPAGEPQLERAVQLTQRTNQFNCTTRRTTETEMRSLLEDQAHQVLTVSVSDRFGDYGLVGLIIAHPQGQALVVENFLLSCRVLGKGVEHRMLAHLGRIARDHGIPRVDVLFRPTPKNQPAFDFLSRVGGPFHQVVQNQSVFHFPAEVAARTRFDPDSAPPPAVVEKTAEAATPAPGGGEQPFIPGTARYAWIAQVACDVGLLQTLIEAKAGSSAAETVSTYAPPETELQRRLCEIWQQMLHLDRVGIREDFFALGGTSLLAVRLVAQLERLTHKKLPLVTLLRAPTIEQLSHALDSKPGSTARSPIVTIQQGGSKPPLFLVHGAGGGILWGYANMAPHLGSEQPVYAIEPASSAERKLSTVESMAEAYVREVVSAHPTGPLMLGGYCFGGYVAYEMARLLAAQGRHIALLALIDSAAPNGLYDRVPWWQPKFYPRFIRNIAFWCGDFMRLSARTRRDFVARKFRVIGKKLRLRTSSGSSKEKGILLEEYIDPTQFPEYERLLWCAHLRAGNEYRPQPWKGRVTLLRTHGQPLLCSLDPQYGWQPLALGGLDIRLIPGSHENIFVEPEVAALGRELRKAIDSAVAPTVPAFNTTT